MREASQADWQTMMTMLHLKEPSLPAPADDPNRPSQLKTKEGSNNWFDEAGQMHVRSGWGNWTNYDESKAGGYTLPNPLVLKNGKPVSTTTTWWQQRRPEILCDFTTEIYSAIPKTTPSVVFSVTGTDTTPGGSVNKKTSVGRIDNSRYIL